MANDIARLLDLAPMAPAPPPHRISPMVTDGS